MFLNDAVDVDFDRQHRIERPIPSGKISVREVWSWSFGLILAGVICLSAIGPTTAILTIFLASSVLLYDFVHKIVAFAPVLMASCRFFLYLVAASSAYRGVVGLAVWSGLALGCYIVGLSYLARKESMRGPLRFWPCYFLAAPVALAWLVNGETGERQIWLIVFAFAAWVLWCLRHILWRPPGNISYTVSGLLAGIVLVDLLAIAPAPPLISMIFVLLFVAAHIFQRYIPAT
jgi:4-hydroxybenzoate polyprenyltransferase